MSVAASPFAPAIYLYLASSYCPIPSVLMVHLCVLILQVCACCCHVCRTNTTATTTSAGARDTGGITSRWVTREDVRCSQGGLVVVRKKEKVVGGGGEQSKGVGLL